MKKKTGEIATTGALAKWAEAALEKKARKRIIDPEHAKMMAGPPVESIQAALDEIRGGTMHGAKARKLLGKAIQPDGSLKETEPSWIVWPTSADDRIEIDGGFTADYLEALAWWMRNGADPLVSLKKGKNPARSVPSIHDPS